MTLTREELGKAYQKIQNYRGSVIGKAIDIEAKIDAILNLYLSKESTQHEFMHKVLDDEYFSFGLKIRILKKINLGLDKKLIKKIERMKNIRNEFAHRVPGVIPKAGHLSISFDDITKDNPKRIEESFEGFAKLINEIEPELDKIFFKLVEENKKDNKKDSK